MTNWMTAAGIALIAGGLATLICFRTVLFGGSGRRAQDQEAGAGIQPKSRRARGSRRRSRSVEEPVQPDALPDDLADDDPRDGLALIGLAEEQPIGLAGEEQISLAGEVPISLLGDEQRDEPYAEDHELYEDDFLATDAAAEPELEPEPVLELEAVEPEPAYEPELPYEPEPLYDPEPLYVPERLGDRVDGWVRPEYRHVPEHPPSGEYWTPIPVELEPDHEPSAKGYGWPMAVERLPAVPDYEPSTGFDLAPVEHEPTEVVTPMPRGRKRRERPSAVDRSSNRISLPRSWSVRDDKGDEPAAREWRVENEALPGRRRAEATELFAAVTDDLPRTSRRRPRPRPRPAAEPIDRSTTMYVSRHAAEPPPR